MGTRTERMKLSLLFLADKLRDALTQPTPIMAQRVREVAITPDRMEAIEHACAVPTWTRARATMLGMIEEARGAKL
jgi:hypothetical protein